MAEVIFKFQNTEKVDERTDIELCAHRWKVWDALDTINNLRRDLYKGRTYKTTILYPVERGKDEFGRDEVSVWTTKESDREKVDGEVNNMDEGKEFIDVDYIVSELEDALSDVFFLFD